MGVKIDEAGSDDQAGGAKNLRIFGSCNFPCRRQLSYFFSIEENIEGRVGPRSGIEDAAVLIQQHAMGPFDRWSGDSWPARPRPQDGCRLHARRRSGEKEAPCE